MRAGKFRFFKTALALAFLLQQQACAPEQANVLRLSNTQYLTRTDEPVTISRDRLTALFGKIPSGKVPELTDSSGKPVASQTDDLNNDGIWDELAFVYSFKPKGSVILNCRYIDKSALPAYSMRTNVRFAKQDARGGYREIKTETMAKDHSVEHTLQRYQLEGPGWENDKIGFRNYFDQRNALDIFGKKTTQMVLDKTDLDEKVAEYMTMQPWGMDILKVAGSLGAGGLGIYEGKTLYRVTGDETTTYKLVTKGPVRSIFTLSYRGVQAGGHKYDVKHEITIWAGMPGYQSRVWLSGSNTGKILVSGIADIKTDTRFSNNSNDFTAIGTHMLQAEGGDALGMALIVKKSDFIGEGTTAALGSGVTQTYYAKMRVKNDQPVSFYFIAGWAGQNTEYSDYPFFAHEVNQIQLRLAHPIVITK